MFLLCVHRPSLEAYREIRVPVQLATSLCSLKHYIQEQVERSCKKISVCTSVEGACSHTAENVVRPWSSVHWCYNVQACRKEREAAIKSNNNNSKKKKTKVSYWTRSPPSQHFWIWITCLQDQEGNQSGVSVKIDKQTDKQDLSDFKFHLVWVFKIFFLYSDEEWKHGVLTDSKD